MDNTKAFNGTDHLEALLDDLRASAFQAGGNGDDGSEAVFKASDALREFFAELAASLPESPIRQQLITKRELEQFAHNGRLADRIQTTDAKLAEATTAKDAAYRERNQLVALLARLYPSGIAQTAIEGWDPAWHGCVYIDLPTGQASWHFRTSEAHLFADLPPYAGSWDGHTTEEKYRRVAALAAQQAAPQAEQQAELSWLPSGNVLARCPACAQYDRDATCRECRVFVPRSDLAAKQAEREPLTTQAPAPGADGGPLGKLIDALMPLPDFVPQQGVSTGTAPAMYYSRGVVREAIRAALAVQAPAVGDGERDDKRMFEQAVRSLAAIDDALGIGDDGCGDLDSTLTAIAELKRQASAPPDKTPFDTCPTCEALALAVMSDQTSSDASVADALDAKRYRFIKSYDNPDSPLAICSRRDVGWDGEWAIEHNPDDVIDAAMASQPPVQPNGEADAAPQAEQQASRSAS